jgi:peptide/nickel transport system substrate-binding protein
MCTATKKVLRSGKYFFALVTVIGLTVGAMVSSVAAETPVRGGTITGVTALEPKSLDPLFGDGGNLDHYVWRQIYESLLGISGSGEVESRLATGWKFTGDKKSIDFALRRGVKFHDGTEFNAEAAAVTFRRALSKELNAPRASDLAAVASVEVRSPYELRINLKSPSSAALPAIAFAGLISSPTAIKKHGQDYGRNPVGTGPFKFTSWQSGSRIVIEKNPDYWRKGVDGKPLPYLDGAIIRFIKKTAVKVIEVKSGNVHVIDTIGAQDLKTVSGDSNLRLVRAGNGRHVMFAFNISKPPFSDIRLRKAILFGLDRQTMMKVITLGRGQVTPTLIPNNNWVYDASLEKYSHDPARAKKLLAEAGHKGGLDARLDIIKREPDSTVAQLMQSQLKEAGINLTIKTVDRQSMQASLRAKNHMFGIGRFTVPGVDPAQTFGRIFGKNARIQRTGVSDTKLFDMIDNAAEQTDQSVRKGLYREIQAYLVDNALYGFLFFMESTQVERTTVKNLKRTVGGAWMLSEAWLAK